MIANTNLSRKLNIPSALSFRLFLFFLLILSSCTPMNFSSDDKARVVNNVPDHFLVGISNGTATLEPNPDEGCRNPMIDPRDGTKIQLIRSSKDRGDYRVPTDRYGVGGKELLRLDCGTGRVVGIVRK